MPRKSAASSGASPAAATKAGTPSTKSPERPRPKICFSFMYVPLVKLAEGGLVVFPALLAPLSRANILKEAALGRESPALDADTFVEPLQKAHDEGRVLMGWSKWRAKEDVLTWAAWDAFVERWCGTTAHRSSNRGPVLEPSVLYHEIVRLQDLKLVTVVGDIPGTPIEDPSKKKKKPVTRGRRTIATNEDEEGDQTDEIDADDEEEDE